LPAQNPHESSFTGSIAPHKTNSLPRLYLARYPVQKRRTAKSDSQILGSDEGHEGTRKGSQLMGIGNTGRLPNYG
jgi:hypothetical protein